MPGEQSGNTAQGGQGNNRGGTVGGDGSNTDTTTTPGGPVQLTFGGGNISTHVATVGTGGTAASPGGSSGGNGGVTSFGSLSSTGGGGGQGAAQGSAGGSGGAGGRIDADTISFSTANSDTLLAWSSSGKDTGYSSIDASGVIFEDRNKKESDPDSSRVSVRTQLGAVDEEPTSSWVLDPDPFADATLVQADDTNDSDPYSHVGLEAYNGDPNTDTTMAGNSFTFDPDIGIDVFDFDPIIPAGDPTPIPPIDPITPPDEIDLVSVGASIGDGAAAGDLPSFMRPQIVSVIDYQKSNNPDNDIGGKLFINDDKVRDKMDVTLFSRSILQDLIETFLAEIRSETIGNPSLAEVVEELRSRRTTSDDNTESAMHGQWDLCQAILRFMEKLSLRRQVQYTSSNPYKTLFDEFWTTMSNSEEPFEDLSWVSDCVGDLTECTHNSCELHDWFDIYRPGGSAGLNGIGCTETDRNQFYGGNAYSFHVDPISVSPSIHFGSNTSNMFGTSQERYTQGDHLLLEKIAVLLGYGVYDPVTIDRFTKLPRTVLVTQILEDLRMSLSAVGAQTAITSNKQAVHGGLDHSADKIIAYSFDASWGKWGPSGLYFNASPEQLLPTEIPPLAIQGPSQTLPLVLHNGHFRGEVLDKLNLSDFPDGCRTGGDNMKLRTTMSLCQMYGREMQFSCGMSYDSTADTLPPGIQSSLTAAGGGLEGYILDDLLGVLPGGPGHRSAFNYPLGIGEGDKRSIMQYLGLTLSDPGQPTERATLPLDTDYVKFIGYLLQPTDIANGQTVAAGVTNMMNHILSDPDPSGDHFLNFDAGSVLQALASESRDAQVNIRKITDYLGYCLGRTAIVVNDSRPPDTFAKVMNGVILHMIRAFTGYTGGTNPGADPAENSAHYVFKSATVYKDATYFDPSHASPGRSESQSLTLNKMLFELFIVGTIVNNGSSQFAQDMINGELTRVFPGDFLSLHPSLGNINVVNTQTESGGLIGIGSGDLSWLNIQDLIDFTNDMGDPNASMTNAPPMNSSLRGNGTAAFSGMPSGGYLPYPVGPGSGQGVASMGTIIDHDMNVAGLADPAYAEVYQVMLQNVSTYYNQVMQPPGFNVRAVTIGEILDPTDPADMATMIEETKQALQGHELGWNSHPAATRPNPLTTVLASLLVNTYEGLTSGGHNGVLDATHTRFRGVTTGGLAYTLFQAGMFGLSSIWDFDDGGNIFVGTAMTTEDWSIPDPGNMSGQGDYAPDNTNVTRCLGNMAAWSRAIQQYSKDVNWPTDTNHGSKVNHIFGADAFYFDDWNELSGQASAALLSASEAGLTPGGWPANMYDVTVDPEAQQIRGAWVTGINHGSKHARNAFRDMFADEQAWMVTLMALQSIGNIRSFKADKDHLSDQTHTTYDIMRIRQSSQAVLEELYPLAVSSEAIPESAPFNTLKFNTPILPAITTERELLLRDVVYTSLIQCCVNSSNSSGMLTVKRGGPSGSDTLRVNSFDQIGKIPSWLVRKFMAAFLEHQQAGATDFTVPRFSTSSTWPVLTAGSSWGDDKEANAKIVTVGIPPFYAENFLNWYPVPIGNQVSIQDLPIFPTDPLLNETTPGGRLSPIPARASRVNINIYKRDLQYPELVFVPQRWEFDLGLTSWNMLPQRVLDDDAGDATIQDNLVIMGSFGNLSLDYDESTIDALGWTDFKDRLRFNRPLFDQAIASAGPSGRLVADVKQNTTRTTNQGMPPEIVINHSVSFFLETYLKLLTGMSVTESSLLKSDRLGALSDPVEARVFRNLIDIHILEKYGLTLNELRDSVPTDTPEGQQLLNLLTAIDLHGDVWTSLLNSEIAGPIAEIGERRALELSSDLKMLMTLFKSKSVFSGGSAVAGKILGPKMFDRVFHILVDPDKFIIDKNLTDMTSTTVQNLITNHFIKVKQDTMGNPQYKLRPRVSAAQGGVEDYETSELFVTMSPGSLPSWAP